MSDPNQFTGVYKQWTLTAGEYSYELVNSAADGTRQFYMVKPGPYGQPIIVAEPDLAFDAPASLSYVNGKGEPVKPVEQIAGIVCQDGPRLSLSNAKNKGISVSTREDGSMQVGGEVWHIATLLCKDKNRIIGYDAFLVKTKPPTVRILELGDVSLF
jgi:hypothetical protein